MTSSTDQLRKSFATQTVVSNNAVNAACCRKAIHVEAKGILSSKKEQSHVIIGNECSM